MATDPALFKGLNVLRGELVCRAVAEGVGMEYVECHIADLKD
jgi:alanine dehydrogenase